MKKLTLSILSVVFVLVLVGCGGSTTPDAPAVANPGTDNPQQPTQEVVVEGEEEVVVENKGEVEVNVEYTTKLANCMSENWTTMYGTERCGHCVEQKAAFWTAFENVDYVDCDDDRQACLDAGVRWFPTWIDADANPYPGTQSLERLAAIAGCEDIE